MAVTRAQRMALRKDNSKRPGRLTEAPRSMWPSDGDSKRNRVWISRYYLVQEFQEECGYRLSVNRTDMLPSGRWDDNLTWDELQEIKRAVGYGDWYAVEVYPPDLDIVNVANMRHLWVLPAALDIGWKRRVAREESACPEQ